MRRLVVIESPLAGDFETNRRYALWCCLDSTLRGEAPFASHVFYTQFLDDQVQALRQTGIQCGLSWGAVAELRALYIDLGVTDGMRIGVESARALGQDVEERYLDPQFHERFLVGETPPCTRGF